MIGKKRVDLLNLEATVGMVNWDGTILRNGVKTWPDTKYKQMSLSPNNADVIDIIFKDQYKFLANAQVMRAVPYLLNVTLATIWTTLHQRLEEFEFQSPKYFVQFLFFICFSPPKLSLL